MMVAQPEASSDARATLLLTAPLGTGGANGPKPLASAEYAALATQLHKRGSRPGDLLSSDARALTREATPPTVEPERVEALLDRGARLSLALSRWTSAGIWIASRADSFYPTHYRKLPRISAPPIVYGIGPIALVDRGGLAVVGSRAPEPSAAAYATEAGRWGARAGIQIVSGAARGVDELAMLSALDDGGTALGVVGESLIKVASRRGFREAIVADRLTLLSSFDPDAGFSVAIAMARNRWVYALADRALIVAYREGSGGTWAGALVGLKSGMRVYVRTGDSERPGNDALVTRGAIPAPGDLDDLWRDLHQSSVATETSPPVTISNETVDARVATDLYDDVVPHVLRLLERPLSAAAIASTLELTKVQTTAWLIRLVEEGRIRKSGSTFQAVASDGEPGELLLMS